MNPLLDTVTTCSKTSARAALTLAACASLALAACDGGEGEPPPPDGGPAVERLVHSSYTIQPGEEFYQCERIVFTEDVYFRRIVPHGGPGTHHTVLAIDPTPEGAGTSPCLPIGPDWRALAGFGIDSNEIAFPPGVAMKVAAGEEIVLNLHLFNATPDPLVGESAVDIEVVPASEVVHEAESLLGGPVGFSVPPGTQTVSGGCTMTEDVQVFAALPHMHMLGRHAKVTLEREAGDVVVIDAPYDFTEQTTTFFDPVPLAAGDRVAIDCTFENSTGATVGFGDSSNQEMCFAAFYRFPKLGSSAVCFN